MKTKSLLILTAFAACVCLPALACSAASRNSDPSASVAHAPPQSLQSFALTAAPEYQLPAQAYNDCEKIGQNSANPMAVRLLLPQRAISETIDGADSLVGRRYERQSERTRFLAINLPHSSRDFRSHEPAAG